MLGRRTYINLIAFAGFTTVLIVYVAISLLFTGVNGKGVTIEFADATGLAPRNDVTMRGVPVGIVDGVALTPKGTAMVHVSLDPGQSISQGTKAEIMRRSAIGDITLELTPGDGPPVPDGGHIPMSDTTTPPDPERTIEVLATVLNSVPPQDLATVVGELATALRGRGQDLATLSVASRQIPETLLQIRTQLESLIVNGPKVTGVLAANADALASDIKKTATLADILRDRRYDLVNLSKNGAAFAEVANGLIAGNKANLACLVADLGAVNSVMAEPGHLADLARTLDYNHFFFDGVWSAVQTGTEGLDWFRVQLVPMGQPAGNSYTPHRAPPGVYGANACRSIYGVGVGPATQPGELAKVSGSTYHPGS